MALSLNHRNDRLELLSTDGVLESRVKSLVEQSERNVEEVKKLVVEVGFKKARFILIISKEFFVSIDVAKDMVSEPRIVRSLKTHPFLMQYLRRSPEEISIDLGRREVRLRITNVHAGYNSDPHKTMESYLRFIDVHTCVFPTPDDVTKEPDELGLLQCSSKGESLRTHRLGALGHVDFTLAHSEGTPVQFMINGQARKAFWYMKNNIRNQYKKWYERTIDAITEIGRSVGIQWVVIPSGETVRRCTISAWGHDVSDTILQQFYDRFAEKREFASDTLEIIHPVTKAAVSGKVWIKRF